MVFEPLEFLITNKFIWHNIKWDGHNTEYPGQDVLKHGDLGKSKNCWSEILSGEEEHDVGQAELENYNNPENQIVYQKADKIQL